MTGHVPPPISDSVPRMREGVAYQFAKVATELIKQVQLEPYQTCITCINFREKAGGICVRFGNVTPPPRVIAYGCRDYFHNDELPF